MKIEKISEEGLKKVFLATLSSQDLDEHIHSYLQERAKTAKIDGFRPGKAPLDKIRSYYEDKAVSNALSVFVDGVEKEIATLIPEGLASPLDIQPKEQFEKGKDFVLEVVAFSKPSFDLCDLSVIEIDDFQFDVPADQIEIKMQNIAKNHDVKETRPDDHVITEKDRVVIRMTAHYGKKKEVKGYNTQRGSLTIDENNKDQEFLINHLRGHKKGDHLRFTEIFPSSYVDSRLAGKTVDFDVEILEVYHFVKLSVSEELAKELKFESLQVWKEKVLEDAKSHYQSFSTICKRRALLDALSTHHPFDVPDVMVEKEFEAIWAQLEESEKEGGAEGKTPEEVRSDCKALADRRVRLGFVVNMLGEAFNVKVYQGDVEKAMWRETLRLVPHYGQEAYKVVSNYYKENPAAYNQMISVILEEKVVSELLARVTLKAVPVTLAELKQKVDEVLPDFWEDFHVEPKEDAEEDAAPDACQHHEGCGH